MKLGLIYLGILVLVELSGTDLVPEELRSRSIQTKYGKVQGFITKVGRDATINKYVQIFLGLPYASAPTGNYRFAPTRPPTHWNGVLAATNLGPVCPQVLPIDLENRTVEKLSLQSEDCLNLNIYVPYMEKSVERYPVMVYIHGDSYEWGSGNLYDGRVLAAHGKVIVITINYRLGILGFLNTNTAPHQHPRMANYGLMDQIAALKWVQQNIEQFGGDPAAVTLFGHRTGAACIHFLMESPAAVAGLFQRAILMSGSGAAPWSMVEDPVHYAVKLAAHLNCSLPSNMLKHHLQIVECLREKTVSEMLRVELSPPVFLSAIGPSRDGVLIPSDFGLHSFQIKKRAASPSYQVLVGVSENEDINLFSSVQLRDGISTHEKNSILRNLARNCYDYHVNEIFFAIETEYTDLTGSSPFRRLELARTAVIDKLYVSPAVETVNWANESGYQAYLYIHKRKEFERAEGGDFLSLVFGLPFAPEISGPFSSPQQALVSQTILTYWSNFAHSGDPNSPSSMGDLFNSQMGLPTWRRFSLQNQDYLELDLDPSSEVHYRPRPMATWLKLIPKLHLSGSDHTYPEHSLLHPRKQYRGLPGSKEDQAQPNLAYDSLQLGAGTPCNASKSLLPSNGSTIRVGESSIQSEKTILFILCIGVLLLSANIWFWVCFVVRRKSIICCMTNDVERKKLSDEPEHRLVQQQTKIPEPGYQRRVPVESVWYDNSDNLSQGSNSRFTSGEEQAISLISSGHVTRTNRDLELYNCSFSKTLPKRCAQPHDQFQYTQIQRAASQELLTSSGEHMSETVPGASKSNLVKVLSSRPVQEEKKVSSRPKLSTFGHTEQFSVQTVQGSKQEPSERYLKPESV